MAHRKTAVIAHRGFSARFPENTLASIEAAIKEGADLVEVDVQETSDGQIVVFHDYQLQRLCGVQGRIHECDLVELRRRKPDVPTLAEALRAVRGHCKLLIEVKHADAEKVVRILRQCNMTNQVILFSFSTPLLEQFAKISPEITRFGLIGRDLPQAIQILKSTAPVAGLALGNRLVSTPAVLTKIHRQGWQVFVWTVNRESRMRELIQWGVDGIITNHPDRARRLIDSLQRESVRDVPR